MLGKDPSHSTGGAGGAALVVLALGISVVLLLGGAAGALLTGLLDDRRGLRVGASCATLACGVGTIASAAALLKPGTEASFRAAWRIPVGSFHIGIDELSAFFLFCIFLVSGIAAVYGSGYLRGPSSGARVSPLAAFFNFLVGSMALVVVARDAVLFIVAWEAMFLASYFLVTHEHERREVRRAGFIYLVASHLGVVFLFILFARLARETGAMQFDFDAFLQAGPPEAPAAAVAFLLALVGFGVKAGFWPLHVWLPEAHPAAPSHVSAVMSGVMIKMGIYGILRTLTFLGPPPAWWGAALITVGIASGIAGLFNALAQRDLKRLLAYSSVENVGIITLGVGLGVLGESQGEPVVSFLGYAGALLHVLNHGLFKALLFQGAGSVLSSTGTRNMDALGGLIRRMPFTAGTFAVAAVAISALPPLGGFVSEWLLYSGAFWGATHLPGGLAIAAVALVPSLALIGGLAAAVFVKAFGLVFLGVPRTPLVDEADEAGPAMRLAMGAGALACVVIGVWPMGALNLVSGPAGMLAGTPSMPMGVLAPLAKVGGVGIVLIILIAFVAALRAALLRGREVRTRSTWGCGYEAPSSRMQYTAMSFPKPLLDAFPLIFTRLRREAPQGYFPQRARRHERLGDITVERLVVPTRRRALDALGFIRVMQSGLVQLYLAYILMTLILLLVWQLSGGAR